MSISAVRRWVRQRMLRRPFELQSSLAPESALAVLRENVAPIPVVSFGGISGGTPFKGKIKGASVRLTKHSGNRNSWRLIFVGGVAPTETGSALRGTIGPMTFVPVFSAIWLGGVTLFLLGGVIGVITVSATGHGDAPWPLVPIPAAMLCFFFLLTEFAGRAASNEWASMSDWLEGLLNPRV